MRQMLGARPGVHEDTRVRGALPSYADEVDLISARLRLPQRLASRARSLCLHAGATKYYRVTPSGVLAAAAVYVACRERNHPVTLKEVAQAGGCDSREVGKCYISVLERMKISRPGLNGRAYVHHIVLARSVPEEAYRRSEEIVRASALSGLGGRNPMTLAAAALYLACSEMGEKMTQSEAAEAAGVGEESVRECCQAIRTAVDLTDYQ